MVSEKIEDSMDFRFAPVGASASWRDRGNDNRKKVVEEPPPILKSWPRLYSIVIINLVFWLLTFYIIRRIFE